MLATAPLASAQSVSGVLEWVLDDTNSNTIESYSANEIDYAAYYDGYLPDLGGALLANGSMVADIGSQKNATFSGTCAAYPAGFDQKLGVCSTVEVPTQPSTTYQQGNIYYVMFNVYNLTYDCWENPAGYGSGSAFLPNGSGGEWGSGTYEDCVPGIYTEQQEVAVGQLGLQFSSAPPEISSISPTGGALGSSGTITVSGQNLIAWTGVPPTVSITGGAMLSVASPPAPTYTSVTLNYSIPSNASTGAQTLTLTTNFGSSTAQFTIGDATPSISCVSPSSWQVGQTTPVTVIGSGFGTNPVPSINDSNVSFSSPALCSGSAPSGCSAPSSTATTDQCFIVSATVNSSDPGGTYNLTVASQGYNGSGYLGSTPGQSGTSPSFNVVVESTPAPVPQIMFNGANVAGTTVNVYAGQEIALTAVVPVSGNLFVQTQSWSEPGGAWLEGGAQTGTATQQPILLLSRRVARCHLGFWRNPLTAARLL